MCGLTGFLEPRARQGADDLQAAVTRMTNTLAHRGPDHGGCWVDAETGVALGHRRLSILDLSPEGHQPMVSVSGRYVITFNGEIYNYRDIRKELDALGNAITWRGHSDTEVMLAAIETWGMKAALERFVGMFSFAMWDRQRRELYLARDRMGEKPLYYGWTDKCFLFGSELKALRVHPSWKGEIERGALALFMKRNYVPSPYCIFKNIYKLIPGTFLRVTPELAAKTPTYTDIASCTTTYWSMKDVAERGALNPFQGSEEDALVKLDELLRNVVRDQMVADVPLGAFLSGGIDSSLIVALMQAQSDRPIKTFTIGFHEKGYNEAVHAKTVARHLGTDHTELYVTPRDAIAVIPRLPVIYDEPFSDSSQIPTTLVSQMVRKTVTVSLSGDGGDELFGGYNHYFEVQRNWDRVNRIPVGVRTLLSRALTTLSPARWNSLLGWWMSLLPGQLKQRTPGPKLHTLASILEISPPDNFYKEAISHWRDARSLVREASEMSTASMGYSGGANLPDFFQTMMFLDSTNYLPDDILVKVDRASMSVSLESRIPLLDHRVVEFAWRIPLRMKVKQGQGKWLLRQLLHKYVPRAITERPKMGFGVPIDRWLRGELRDWAESLLDEHRIRQEGFFNPEPIREAWADFQSGRQGLETRLWNVLMFQAWNEYWTKAPSNMCK